MKKFIAILALIVSFGAQAESKYLYSPYWIDSVRTDSTLSPGQSIFEFHFPNIEYKEGMRLLYSDNGVEYRVEIPLDRTVQVQSQPGKHTFEVWVSDDYAEIFTDSIAIQGQQIISITFEFMPNIRNDVMKKPVIYLYPEVATEISVNVEPNGEFVYTYPRAEDGTWNVTANSEGELEVNGDSYNYLFWESLYERQFDPNSFAQGFVVSGKNIHKELESKLTAFGLNSKERADFMTFWAPQMLVHDYVYFRFEINDACNEYAELMISPTPDVVNRLYMIWCPISPLNCMKPAPQKIEPFDRTGFDVLEWGGSKTSSPLPITSSVNH